MEQSHRSACLRGAKTCICPNFEVVNVIVNVMRWLVGSGASIPFGCFVLAGKPAYRMVLVTDWIGRPDMIGRQASLVKPILINVVLLFDCQSQSRLRKTS